MARFTRAGVWGWVVAAAAGVGAAVGAGCAAPPAEGEVRASPLTGARATTLEAPLGDAYEASFWALQDLGFLIVGREMDALQGSVRARTADRIQVDVRLRWMGDERTGMVVNAGPLHGDVSVAVVEAVGAELGG